MCSGPFSLLAHHRGMGFDAVSAALGRITS
jgi:hypothetical protein